MSKEHTPLVSDALCYEEKPKHSEYISGSNPGEVFTCGNTSFMS